MAAGAAHHHFSVVEIPAAIPDPTPNHRRALVAHFVAPGGLPPGRPLFLLATFGHGTPSRHASRSASARDRRTRPRPSRRAGTPPGSASSTRPNTDRVPASAIAPSPERTQALPARVGSKAVVSRSQVEPRVPRRGEARRIRDIGPPRGKRRRHVERVSMPDRRCAGGRRIPGAAGETGSGNEQPVSKYGIRSRNCVADRGQQAANREVTACALQRRGIISPGKTGVRPLQDQCVRARPRHVDFRIQRLNVMFRR